MERVLPEGALWAGEQISNMAFDRPHKYVNVGDNGRAAMADSSMPVALRTLKDVVGDNVRDTQDRLAGMMQGNKLQQQKFMHLVTSIMHANKKMIIGKAFSWGPGAYPEIR